MSTEIDDDLLRRHDDPRAPRDCVMSRVTV
jgi:hypothetical protein